MSTRLVHDGVLFGSSLAGNFSLAGASCVRYRASILPYLRQFSGALHGCRLRRVTRAALAYIIRIMPRCATVNNALASQVLSKIIDAELTIESQEPVQSDIASLLTPRQLTRLSCPWRVPTLSPRRTSQTCDIVSMDHWQSHKRKLTLHSKSSYPAKSSLPETENATDVMPHTGSGSCTQCVNKTVHASRWGLSTHHVAL